MPLHPSVSSNTNSSNTNSPPYSSKASKFWHFLKFDRFLQVCSSVYKALVNPLNTNDDPKLAWKRDRKCGLYLEVYDPTTEIYWYFQSEQEALAWLEQRYYTQPDYNYQAKIELNLWMQSHWFR